MTGKTYEQRVKAAQGFSLTRFIRSIRKRINKPDPINYANVRRDGAIRVNPRLMGASTEEAIKRKDGK